MELSKFRIIILVSIAGLFSLGFFLPHLLIPRLLPKGQIYHPLLPATDGTMQAVDQTNIYAPKTLAILNGRILGDLGIQEYQQLSPYISEAVPASLLAGLTRLSGSLENAFMFGNAIFPPITFLLVFILLFSETNRFLLSLAGAGITLFADPLTKWLFFPQKIIEKLLFFENWQSFLVLTRQFHPGTSLPIWLLFLVSFSLYLKGNRRRFLVLSIFSGAILPYTYPVTFLTTISGMGIFIAFLLIKKNVPLLLQVLKPWPAIVLCWTPYIVVTYLTWKNGIALDLANKYAETVTPSFQLAQSGRYFIFLLLFSFYPRKRSISTAFLTSLLWASLLLFLAPIASSALSMANDRFILRVFPFLASSLFFISLADLIYRQKDGRFYRHRHLILALTLILLPWRTNMIIASIIVFLGIVCFFLYIPKKLPVIFSSLFLGITLVISVLHPFWIHYQASYQLGPKFQLQPDQQNLVNWIIKKTPSQSVFGTLELEETLWLQAQTGRYLFYPRLWLTTATIENLEDRFLILNAVFGIPGEQIILPQADELAETVVSSGLNIPKWLAWYSYGFRYHRDQERRFIIPSAEIDRIQNRYQTQQLTDGCSLPHRLDYLLLGAYTKRNLSPSIKPCWETVFQNSSYIVYQRRPQ
ncbi:hypothetical protein HYU89_03240 [Candidatus Collierbacteria bacterium]|nr:hypothetical protein [Candidatus Collierbacteria bacterium]